MTRACKHLDYTEGKYGPDITLQTLDGFDTEVKYWLRGPTWTDGGSNPAKVQFCKLRGRINDIFSCYNIGERSCHDMEVKP